MIEYHIGTGSAMPCFKSGGLVTLKFSLRGSEILLQNADEFLQSRLIVFGETSEQGTVDVENADDFPVFSDRHDNFGI